MEVSSSIMTNNNTQGTKYNSSQGDLQSTCSQKHYLRFSTVALTNSPCLLPSSGAPRMDKELRNLQIEQGGSLTLTSVAQLVGHCPTKQKVTWSIPGQGTRLGCGLSPQLGSAPPINVSLSHRCFSPLSASLPPSLKIIK